MSHTAPMFPDVPNMVFYIPAEKWIFKNGDSWDFSSPVKKTGAIAHLVTQGWDQTQARIFIESFVAQTVVYGQDMMPGAPPIYRTEDGKAMINLWTPPEVLPAPGEFPTIQANVEWLANGDAEGVRYIHHFFARKYQNPALCSKVALSFATAQGAGKGFLFCVMSHLLGTKNSAIIKQSDLKSNFNGRSGRALLGLADEILSQDSGPDDAQAIKIMVDGSDISFERKYENAITVRNRSTWIFASNSPVSPLSVEDSDRRFTFFSNFNAVPPEYTARLDACFESDRTTPTAAFLAEIAAYGHYLRSLEVDVRLVSRPYKNDARESLIDASRPSYEVFFRELELQGFDAVWDHTASQDFKLLHSEDASWDFGADGVATGTIYQLYRAFCKINGYQSLRLNKFGAALKNHVPKWAHSRQFVAKERRQVWCYAIPRSPKKEQG